MTLCQMGQDRPFSNEELRKHMYDSSVAPELIRNTSATRGNKYKLLNHTFQYNFRKFSFAAHIVNIWNSLPDCVVDVDSVALFKQELSCRQQITRQLCTQYAEGIYRLKYYTVTLKSRLRVTQGHWKRNHWIDHTRLSNSLVI